MDQDISFSNAISYLDKIDVEENNWRASRKKLRDVIDAAKVAHVTLQDLDTKIAERKQALQGLQNSYDSKNGELKTKLEQAEKDAKETIKSLDKDVVNTRTITNDLITKINEDAKKVTARLQELQKQQDKAESELSVVEHALAEARAKHAAFIKSISGGA